MYFHRTVRDRTATAWRRCSIAVDRWRCRPDFEGGWGGGGGVRLLGRNVHKIRFFFIFFYFLAKKFVKRTVR